MTIKLRPSFPETPAQAPPDREFREFVIGLIVAVFLLIAGAFCLGVAARAEAPADATPDMIQWFQSLMQPDYPTASCCGPADAYHADKVKECEPLVPDCAFVAIITDTRTIPGRPHLDVGTEIIVPRNKIRKVPSENPTEHNIVFVNTGRHVYCWEPVALI